jgi:hypothetical protein
MFPDFICYWTAGKLLASGQSPYDARLQALVQQEHGWDKAATGVGVYDFLPYYYPPWFGLLWVLLVPLGYSAARVAWFFFNVEMALVAGYLLGRTVTEVPPWIPVLLGPAFFFSLACVSLGQTALLVLFLLCLAWWLLEQGRDWSAGVALAWLTLKPQLTAVLLAAVLLWALRRGRWSVVIGFAISLVALALVCMTLVPSWPIQMWNAMRTPPPPPTEIYPWIGNTWLLLLRTCGLQGPALWLLYLAVALPFLGVVVRVALDRTRPLSDVLGLGTLAAFLVAPYARHYDFPILLVPLLILLNGRLPRLQGRVFLIALALFPYVQLFVLVDYKARHDPSGHFLPEVTFFWVPVLLALCWIASDMLRLRASASRSDEKSNRQPPHEAT